MPQHHHTEEDGGPSEEEGGRAWSVKRIAFMDRPSVPILMQNQNGPCPLLALANVLSLRNQLQLPPGSRERVELGILVRRFLTPD